MNKLGVNIDHVATVRQARRTNEPDPVWAAAEAELGGADGITVHLREDRRHINDRDVQLLKQTVAVKFNLEMSIQPAIVKIATKLRPDQCTLVPERREELTTEGGLDVVRFRKRVREVVRKLNGAGIVTSAFIEPIREQIEACADCGFDAIELWTGAYAHARTDAASRRALNTLAEGLEHGFACNLTVHAGHGLTYRNIEPVAHLGGVDEFNIGHSIVSRAVFVGLREAVREMKALLSRATTDLALLQTSHRAED
ncbi:Pyridoxine 5'-phosphate synthase [Phycisphaerae bacterium RAS1]|nr:Pyridoxine 5'-phosphate synthase [Phycisphaerae bacterium RAS1]